MIASYQAILDTYPFLKYLFKTDDDQMLLSPKFFDILTKLIINKKPSPHYGGFILNIQTHLSKYWMIHPELPKDLFLQKTKYCNGRFYFLSKEAIQYLVTTKRKEIEKEYFEDYAIGLNLEESHKENMLYIDTNKYFVDIQ